MANYNSAYTGNQIDTAVGEGLRLDGSGATAGQVLAYDGDTSKYKPKTLAGKEWASVSVSAGGWSSDSTVSGYTYKQTVTLTGCTADMVVVVPPFADSGKFASECNTVANGLEIWSNSNTIATTIPLVKQVL